MNNSTNNNTFTNSDEENNNNENYYFIIILCFFLMILTYISIYKIYCIHYDNNTKRENNKPDNSYEYEPLFNNYGTLEEF